MWKDIIFFGYLGLCFFLLGGVLIYWKIRERFDELKIQLAAANRSNAFWISNEKHFIDERARLESRNAILIHTLMNPKAASDFRDAIDRERVQRLRSDERHEIEQVVNTYLDAERYYP